MLCNKKVKDCSECEMLQETVLCFIDDRIESKRYHMQGFRCGLYGGFDTNMDNLRKTGGLQDDLVFVSDNPIALDYINEYKNRSSKTIKNKSQQKKQAIDKIINFSESDRLQLLGYLLDKYPEIFDDVIDFNPN